MLDSSKPTDTHQEKGWKTPLLVAISDGSSHHESPRACKREHIYLSRGQTSRFTSEKQDSDRHAAGSVAGAQGLVSDTRISPDLLKLPFA